MRLRGSGGLCFMGIGVIDMPEREVLILGRMPPGYAEALHAQRPMTPGERVAAWVVFILFVSGCLALFWSWLIAAGLCGASVAGYGVYKVMRRRKV